MSRLLALFAIPILLLGVTACGGGGDDDDDAADDDDNGGSSGDDRTDSSNATGSLTVDGKDYKLDLYTCQLGKKDELTVIGATLEGEKEAEFSASGIGSLVAIAVNFGNSGYIAVGQELDIDGKSVKWDGDLLAPANPQNSVKGKFSFKC